MHEHHTLANAYDVIIAGGGAAGLSAALTLGRARRRVLVIDSAEPRNRFAGHMHGVLGHDGLPPLELLTKGRRELENYGVTLTAGRVQDVADVVRGLQVTLADGTVEYTRSLLVASGIDDELPDLPGLAEHWGGAAFQCPYCHGWEVRDRRIGILATSDAAVHHALLLRQWTDKLTIFPVGAGGTDLVNRLSDRDAEPAEASNASDTSASNAHTRAQFLARGINLVTSPVDEVLSTEGELSGLRTHDGTVHPVDALAVSPIPHPRDEFLHSLELSKTDLPGPFPGPFLSTDPMGLTSHPRIWAVGTIVQPWLNVPASTGQASMVAAFLNFALVEEDTLTALRTSKAPSHWPDVTEDGFWEATYADAPTRWSGRPNSSLVSYLSDLSTPASAEANRSANNRGRAADIGCGEGADAIWLASHGWHTTGVEVSTTAVGRASTAADAAGVADLVKFTDSGILGVADAEFDLVTASYLHAPAQDRRESLLRTIGSLVSTGGHLFLLSHVLPDDTAPADPTTADAAELTSLGLEADQWTVVRAGLETRAELVPGGSVIASQDRVLLLQRR